VHDTKHECVQQTLNSLQYSVKQYCTVRINFSKTSTTMIKITKLSCVQSGVDLQYNKNHRIALLEDCLIL